MKQPYKIRLKPKEMINGVFYTTLIYKIEINRMNS